MYRLRHPRLKKLKDGNSINYVLRKDKKITSALYDCKIELEEILSKHSINFDDNYIDFQRDKDDIFKKYGEIYVNEYEKSREGEVVYNKKVKGYTKLIKYRGHDDVDVEFPDGAIRSGVAYNKFKSGELQHPNKTPKAKREQRINEIRTMNNGMSATIIECQKATNMKVCFEDGTVVSGVRYDHFKNGNVANPNLKKNSI